MPDVNFLQIHSLHGYSAALLNRDDSGLAKRMTYGGAIRTRISSQCLKRHWRIAGGPHSLHAIDGATAGVRSRETVTRRVIGPLAEAGYDTKAVEAIEAAFQRAVYGEKGETSRQPLLLGEPEIRFLANKAREIADASGSDAKATEKAAKEWEKAARANMKALRENCRLPGGIAAALFGRMVTSDVEANLDAPVHVAHAFTVHGEESESDYFTVVDDLQRGEDEPGADHIGETELTSGLFYGYVVLDRKMLLDNVGGDDRMAGTVAEHLVHLIATVSPGAKLGSTAPYAYASWVLIEAGNCQPRSLAEAFRDPCPPSVEAAQQRACAHLAQLDAAYATGESRRVMSLSGSSMPGAELLALPELSQWAGTAISTGTA
ncbi:MAG: type I-E CRISPR-associated protein Cas7/Cse4/CasC [Spirochaetaceae bacterium]|nr:type I-E CRISPR-associated protein Cas7/Cse4/CasC [Spirochaetaceae bacterium]